MGLFDIHIPVGWNIRNLCADNRLTLMAFTPPWSNLYLMLLNDRHKLPWITTEKMLYESPLTGEEYEIPRHFRTDLVTMPKMVAALPGVGSFVLMQFFGKGVWLGAREAVLHDWLRRVNPRTKAPPVPAFLAHRIFREALYSADYNPEMIELYYKAVVVFNSTTQ